MKKQSLDPDRFLHNFKLKELVNLRPQDLLRLVLTSSKWLFIGGTVGVLGGTASAIFLTSLAWATQTRIANTQLLYFLPIVGFIVAFAYHKFGANAKGGNNLVIAEANKRNQKIPLRMAPLVLIGTILTHLFGGSAGREGTAIQMGASLADALRRILKLKSHDKRLIIMAGISAGFGSVFGVPIAGFLFGMEVQKVGKIRYEGMIPCFIASVVGDLTARYFGAPHTHYPQLAQLDLELLLATKVAIAGLFFGLTSLAFIELTHAIKYTLNKLTIYAPFYPLMGGSIIVILSLILGTRDYNGLSLPLIDTALTGVGVTAFAFAIKLLFTSITLGSGYLGGEVTPLFVIGSTLGFSLGSLLGVDPSLLAAIGLVAVFAGASNTPLACAIMGIEIFGSGAGVYIFIGCIGAYLSSGHRGIYLTQVLAVSKSDTSSQSELQKLENMRNL
jgi:H+/Cl- antiporter ClcA